MDNSLDKVIGYADQAHDQQLRKYSPDRYIVHPVRVMEHCRKFTNDPVMLAAAILHDVLEDTPVTSEQLHTFLLTVYDASQAQAILELVIELTDVYVKKAYPQMNRRKRKDNEAARMTTISAGAQTIKYADILDNSLQMAEQDKDFAPVYLRESLHLLKIMVKGNPQLREEAIAVIKHEQQQL